eukprot:c25615_g3_i1 orf=958-1233(+)
MLIRYMNKATSRSNCMIKKIMVEVTNDLAFDNKTANLVPLYMMIAGYTRSTLSPECGIHPLQLDKSLLHLVLPYPPRQLKVSPQTFKLQSL